MNFLTKKYFFTSLIQASLIPTSTTDVREKGVKTWTSDKNLSSAAAIGQWARVQNSSFGDWYMTAFFPGRFNTADYYIWEVWIYPNRFLPWTLDIMLIESRIILSIVSIVKKNLFFGFSWPFFRAISPEFWRMFAPTAFYPISFMSNILGTLYIRRRNQLLRENAKKGVCGQ